MIRLKATYVVGINTNGERVNSPKNTCKVVTLLKKIKRGGIYEEKFKRLIRRT